MLSRGFTCLLMLALAPLPSIAQAANPTQPPAVKMSAEDAPSDPASLPPGSSKPVVADPYKRFASEIAAFQKKEKDLGAVTGGVLFIGSSSIRHWDVASSFPKYTAINHGFGGSGIGDVLHYYPELISVYKPDAVIVYIGENDIAGDPQSLTARTLTLLDKLHSDLPKAHIAYLSLKPGSTRWKFWPKMQAINSAIKAESDYTKHFDFIDVATPLLGADGLPDDSLFVGDHVHLNPKGYAIWNRIVQDYLDKTIQNAPVLADGGTKTSR